MTPRDDLTHLAEAVTRLNAFRSPSEVELTLPVATQQAPPVVPPPNTELTRLNEEIRCIRSELEAARKRYQDLYELAPVGY
jgi:hypothetical protein